MRSKSLFIFCLLIICLVGQVKARIMLSWIYDELHNKSDLIVISHPIEVNELNEEFDLPNIFLVDSSGNKTPHKALGVETKFEILTTLKGENGLKDIILHHYRSEEDYTIVKNGPSLMKFEPKGCEKFLMFLKVRNDGQYEGVAGQTDLIISIKNLGCR